MKLQRRSVLWLPAVAAGKTPREELYRVRTDGREIEIRIHFHDHYTGRGLLVRDSFTGRQFCLAGMDGDGHCAAGFHGSFAIAHYRVRGAPATTLRERVRTLDRHHDAPARPLFERAITLISGTGSDVQAFGQPSPPPSTARVPWLFYRQELFLENESQPFLLIYWKHSLEQIRVLDVIPGEQAWLR